MKFRKKPIIIEAEQWFPGKDIEGVVLTTDIDITEPYPVIETLEGELLVKPGDWIITGIAGERYPCKDSIFKETYEPV